MTGLIIHSLKSKKNWFLLNIAICIVVAIVLPILFKSAYEFFSVSALFIASLIILISTFSDLIFLHDDRKISYYLSKPISLTKRINIALISNVIFCTITFLLTFLIASASGSILSNIKYMNFIDKYLSYIQVMYAWLMLFIFIITLSSELTGNTTVSVLVSLFNFMLPLILYFITTYIFYILDSVIIGISTEIMSKSLLENILPLDKIYFIDYGVKGNIDVFFFIRLFASCAVVYIITIIFAKKRKNERTGDFIIHSSFKYFMSLFASLIAPMLITMVMMGSNLFTLVVVLVILSMLSYYILISAFNKTFKISIQALKIYIPFIIIIITAIFTTSFILNEKSAYVPDDSDVKAVYIGDSLSYLKGAKMLKETSYNWRSLLEAKYEEVKGNDSLVILHEKESIKKVIELQQMLMSEEPTHTYREVNIIYYLNNGKKVVRTYKLPDNYKEEFNEYDTSIYTKIMEIARMDEFIKARYKIFCDENYINNVKFKNVFIYSSDGTKTLVNFDYKTFAKYYLEDYTQFINNDKNVKKISLNILSHARTYDFIEQTYAKTEAIDIESEKYGINNIYEINIERSIDDGISLDYLSLNKELLKTRQYIESLKIE